MLRRQSVQCLVFHMAWCSELRPLSDDSEEQELLPGTALHEVVSTRRQSALEKASCEAHELTKKRADGCAEHCGTIFAG